MKIIQNIIFAILIPLVGCQNSKDSESQSIPEAKIVFTEAMTIHDEVMPRMDEIHKLKKELTLQLGKIESEEVIQKIKITISDLEKADDGMMDWMHNVVKYPDQSTKEEGHTGHDHSVHDADTSLSIHLKQKEAIIQVKSDMVNAIDKAKKLVNPK